MAPILPGIRLVPRRFYGRVELDLKRAIRDLESILDNIVEHLASTDGGEVTLSLEVQASSEGSPALSLRLILAEGKPSHPVEVDG